MDWKKETLQSLWKINKEKLIFVFCSGLLLFLLATPSEPPESGKAGEAGGAYEAEGGSLAGAYEEAASPKGQAADSYERDLETRIREILSEVEGVGQVDVMVVLKTSAEQILHTDKNSSVSTSEETEEGKKIRASRQEEIATTTVLEGQSPIVEKEVMPEISGIVINAEGGGSARVKSEISGAMEALFGLPPHKIKVLKRINKGA